MSAQAIWATAKSACTTLNAGYPARAAIAKPIRVRTSLIGRHAAPIFVIFLAFVAVMLTRSCALKPVNLLEYEPLAQARVDADAWDYYQGGSDDEVTLRANRSAFERIRLRPRMLIDASKTDMRTTVL